MTFDLKFIAEGDIILRIDAANELCNSCDERGLDRTSVRRSMEELYPELVRRIKAKADIRKAVPLIRALYRYIYGRGFDDADRGPAERAIYFRHACRRVVDAYRAAGAAPDADYLYCLLHTATDTPAEAAARDAECRSILNGWLADMPTATLEQCIARVCAYRTAALRLRIDPTPWAEEIYRLSTADTSTLPTNLLTAWSEATDTTAA